MISTELQGYFDYSLNAIFIVREDKIEYCNAASKKVIPGIGVGDDCTKILQVDSAGGRPGIIFTSICGKQCRVSVIPKDDCVIYTVYDGGEHDGEPENTDYVAPACSALRDALASLKISGDILSSFVDGTDDKKIESYFTAAAHSYYKLPELSEIYPIWRISELIRRSRQKVSTLPNYTAGLLKRFRQ